MSDKTVRETKRADELKPGDWTIYLGKVRDFDGLGRAEVLFARPYTDEIGNAKVYVTVAEEGYRGPQSARIAADEKVQLLAEDEIRGAREQAERAQKIADIRALADFLEANPEVPLALYPSEQVDLHDGAASVAQVRELAAKFGGRLRDDLDDRTQAYLKFGSFEYRVIAWHNDGRPAELAPEPAEPTGLAYSRADDGDDPTPVSGARVPSHFEDGKTDRVMELPPVETPVVRYFSFGHGQTDPDDPERPDLVNHYVTVIAPSAEACREAMLASRFGREWAFEYVPGTPQANEWIPRWTEYDRIDAMSKSAD